MLGYPPVILLFEVADGDDPVTGPNGELGFRRGPSNEGGGSTDSEKDESRFVPRGRRLPNQGVPVYSLLAWKYKCNMLGRVLALRAGNNATAMRSDVHTSDSLIVALQLILELKSVSHSAVQLDIRVSGHSQSAMVSRERVVCNGVMEQVVNLGIRHTDELSFAIGVALYYRRSRKSSCKSKG